MRKQKVEPVPAVQKVDYDALLGGVAGLLEEARHLAARSVNAILTATYWEIGRRIVEFEQRGERRAEYGQQLLVRLAGDLTARFGRGFGYRNVNLIRQFYLTYEDRRPILQSPPGESPGGILQSPIAETRSATSASADHSPARAFVLSWTHYVRLLPLDDRYKRDFYEEEARRGGWPVRQLDRQINSMLYERVALSRQKGELLGEAEWSGTPASMEELIKAPMCSSFLVCPSPTPSRTWSAP